MGSFAPFSWHASSMFNKIDLILHFMIVVTKLE